MLTGLSSGRRFAVRTFCWVVGIVLASFAPFGAVYVVKYLLNDNPVFTDIVSAGDLILISTAIAAGAATDLLLTSENTPRSAVWVNFIVAGLAFAFGCLVFSAVNQAQEAAGRAQAALSATRDTSAKALESLSTSAAAPDRLPELSEAHRQAVSEKEKIAISTDETLSRRNTFAKWLFGGSVLLGIMTIAIEVFCTKKTTSDKGHPPTDERV